MGDKKNSLNDNPLVAATNQFLKIQSDFLQSWQDLMQKANQDQLEPPKDRRFSGDAWFESKPSLFSAHAYLLLSQTLQDMVQAANLDKQVQDRLEFSVMQWVAAMSPANFLATNPSAINDLIETKGASLQQGIANLIADMREQKITQTDESAFTLGENLATTEGAVIYENELFQLIQYKPLTPKVKKLPLLMVPPCINKYYILDLQPENSFVRHAVESGLEVFLISWRNPTENDADDLSTKNWDDYIQDGILKAISLIKELTRQPKINALGFCVGGTMLASALSVARARGQNHAASLTLLTTFLDFSDTGIMDVFVDEFHALTREKQIGSGGLLSAAELATTFSFLRPSELVWNYVGANYLRGKTPKPFDILAWNADGTNLPGPFFTWYFRNTYLENRLKSGELKIGNTVVDLSKLDMPVYLYASRDDHIVPWRSAYDSTKILTGELRFVLGESGHVAGVINPPKRGKRGYWYYDSDELPETADQWFDQSTHTKGSWWPDWIEWLIDNSGGDKPARKTLGNKKYPIIEPAPGRYVKIKA